MSSKLSVLFVSIISATSAFADIGSDTVHYDESLAGANGAEYLVAYKYNSVTGLHLTSEIISNGPESAVAATNADVFSVVAPLSEDVFDTSQIDLAESEAEDDGVYIDPDSYQEEDALLDPEYEEQNTGQIFSRDDIEIGILPQDNEQDQVEMNYGDNLDPDAYNNLEPNMDNDESLSGNNESGKDTGEYLDPDSY